MNKFMVVIAGVLILAAAGCREKIEPGTAKVERPLVADVATTETGLEKIPLFHEATATVTAELETMVSSRIMGPVAAITVKEGDKVKKNQLLLVIDSEDINSKVAAAEAAYREALQALNGAGQNKKMAEATYNRFKNLFVERALSLHELEKIETRKNVAFTEYTRIEETVKRAEAGLAEAKVFLGYKEILSPVDGIVTGKFIDPGTMAMPGMKLLTVEDTSRYRLEAEIDERFAEKIYPGMEVEIDINALQKTLPGRISETVPAVDPRSRTFKIFITLPPVENLHSGFYARVKIPVGRQELLLIPAEALVARGQLSGVYVVDANRVITYRLVRVGKKYGNSLEVLSGLKPGETIIVSNVSRVADGGILQTEK